MLSTQTNIIIIISLLIINIIPIYIFSYRKKKFGIYSTIIFTALFIIYLFYYAVPFKGSIDKKQYLHELERTQDEENNADTKQIHSDIQKEEGMLVKHLKNLDILLRISSIQSIICIILCLTGLTLINGRNRFYITLLSIHSFMFCVCCWLEISEHFIN